MPTAGGHAGEPVEVQEHDLTHGPEALVQSPHPGPEGGGAVGGASIPKFPQG